MNKRPFYLLTGRRLFSLANLFVISMVIYLCLILINRSKSDQDGSSKISDQVIPHSIRGINLGKNNSNFNNLLKTEKEPNIEINFEKDYRIHTNGCKIKSLPLFDNETIVLFENNTEAIWQCSRDIVHIKRFDETWISLSWTEVDYTPLCYYRKLERGYDDFHFNYAYFKGPIENRTVNFPGYHFVNIVCYKNNETNPASNFSPKDRNLIHNQIIPLIPVLEKKTNSSAPNILLLAIDSTSYINFQRHFIRTKKFIDKNDFFELRGYNKVGKNTFPNMIPFFTGKHSWELASDQEIMRIQFDNWPIIWKDFSAKGFVTAFVEEMGWFGLFQFGGNEKAFTHGFKNKPTDYETRPFHILSENLKNNHFCIRDRTETQHSLEWTHDFIKAMDKRKQKYFAYISVSHMTHNWLNAGHYMDVPYHNFFKKIFDENLVKNTVILFFSDHGLRTGPIRMTQSGEVENRLPFMFIHFSDNFKQEYVDNLKTNQYRLTTAFDIHATLVNLIHGEDKTLPHGKSLISEVISGNRDCQNASIPDQFCSCFEDIPEHNFTVIKPKDTVPKIVKSINDFGADYRKKCKEFEFSSIKRIYRRVLTKSITNIDPGVESHVYLVQIYVNPGMALFETIIKGYDSNKRFEVISEMNRINRYGNQAHCIEHKVYRNFCYCRDLLKN